MFVLKSIKILIQQSRKTTKNIHAVLLFLKIKKGPGGEP
jgi:hypothetical protein